MINKRLMMPQFRSFATSTANRDGLSMLSEVYTQDTAHCKEREN